MKKILPVLLLIFFLIPFSFFALWFDIQFHSMWGYALSLLVTCLLGIAFFFLKSPTLFVAGHFLSFLSSQLFGGLCNINDYFYYTVIVFPSTLITLLSIFFFLASLLGIFLVRRIK